MRIEALHGDQNREDAMAFAEGRRGFAEGGDVAAVFRVHLGAGLMEIDGAVLALLISAGSEACEVFRKGSLHWPNKRMNRAKHEDGSFFVPAGFAQYLARVFRGMRLEGPSGVRAELGGNA